MARTITEIKGGNLIENLLEDVEIWIDGGHNQDAAKAIASTLRTGAPHLRKFQFTWSLGLLTTVARKNFLQYFTNVIDTMSC